MSEISAIGLFCEDIREEKSGTDSLIGVLPDNMNIPQANVVMPKLCAYVRINFRPDYDPGEVAVILRFPDGSTSKPSVLGGETLQRARNDALKSGSPFVGVITKYVMTPYHIRDLGRVEAIVRHRLEEKVCGAINFRILENAGSS